MFAETIPGGRVLLLGATDPLWTQECPQREIPILTSLVMYRNFARCNSLRSLKFKVKSCGAHDDKHLLNHCRAKLCDARRLRLCLDNKWGPNYKYKLEHIMLDYFESSPVRGKSIL